jgi:hypothetical protein
MSKIKVNYHQGFMDSMHSDFVQGQIDRGIFYWPNNYEACTACLKYFVDHQQSVKKSITIKTNRPVRTVTSSKDR